MTPAGIEPATFLAKHLNHCATAVPIILGLIKNFVKIMDRNSTGLMYLKNKLPRISDDNIKEGVCVGPQMRVNTGRKI